jgi:glycosyltransferase involved in cell wall biosynthesis
MGEQKIFSADDKNISSEPWDISFWKRLKNIQDTSRKKKVIYIYEQADTSTFRYRVYNMCQSLNYSDLWIGSYFFQNELEMIKDYLKNIDVVVICRVRWSPEIDYFLSVLKRKKIPILFDIDDLVFKIDSLPLVMNTLNVDFKDPGCYGYWFSYASRLWLTGTLCDGAIGTNAFLCEKLKEVFHKPSYIINNFLNDEQIIKSNELFNKKEKNKKGNEFVIGYFSGTPSHINDFKKVVPELVELLTKYPNITLEVIGFMEFPEYLKNNVPAKQIIHSPLVDFLTLQEKIAMVDVNIIPLVDNEFTNCKSELKFFEAAIVGAITCATPTFVYKENIKNGETGFLCNIGDWYHCIEKIYGNKFNKKDMVTRAKDYCLENYSPKKQSSQIEKALNSAINNK